METIGRHLIAEFYSCDTQTIDSKEAIERHLVKAATTIGATVVNYCFHKYSPQGVSGTVLIAESHLSIHTWPENRYVAVDIYTCGGLDPRPGFRYLGRALGATECRVQEIVRGLPEDLEGGRTLLPDDVQVITERAEAVSFSH